MTRWSRIVDGLGNLAAFVCTVTVGVAIGCALSLGEVVREDPEKSRARAASERPIGR